MRDGVRCILEKANDVVRVSVAFLPYIKYRVLMIGIRVDFLS
jgi:hypothetical protein